MAPAIFVGVFYLILRIELMHNFVDYGFEKANIENFYWTDFHIIS